MTELGGIYSNEDDLIDILIYSDIKTENQTINKLINQLPKYENGCFNYYTYKHMNSWLITNYAENEYLMISP